MYWNAGVVNILEICVHRLLTCGAGLSTLLPEEGIPASRDTKKQHWNVGVRVRGASHSRGAFQGSQKSSRVFAFSSCMVEVGMMYLATIFGDGICMLEE
jgi:hypothetical protein